MRRTALDRQRPWFAAACSGCLPWPGRGSGRPGIPVLWGPSASAEEIGAGRALFEHQWEPNDPLAKGDGLGPVFNARSCVACHVPDLGGVRGVYSDFLLYTLEEPAPPGGTPGDGYGRPEPPPEAPRSDDLPKPEVVRDPSVTKLARK
jgi:hypothetical protein